MNHRIHSRHKLKPWWKVYFKEIYQSPDPYIKDKDFYDPEFLDKLREAPMLAAESHVDVTRMYDSYGNKFYKRKFQLTII